MRDPYPIHHLPHQDFLNELRRLGGMPKEVLEIQELMELILPSLRADFEATETYIYRDEPLYRPQSPCSVDGVIRDHTTGRYFSVQMLFGDHFFIHSTQKLLLDLIVSELRHGQLAGA